MSTRIERRKYTCPFRENGVCGGEQCRCWDGVELDCGLKYGAATAGDMFSAVSGISDKLGELVKLFREVVITVDDEPYERTRNVD